MGLNAILIILNINSTTNSRFKFISREWCERVKNTVVLLHKISGLFILLFCYNLKKKKFELQFSQGIHLCFTFLVFSLFDTLFSLCYVSYILRFNDLLALEVWMDVPTRPRWLKSFDSTLQVFRMYLLALMAYTDI